MYYAFFAPNMPAPSRSNRFFYFIRIDRFMDEAFDEAFEYDWNRRSEKLLEDPAAQYENHIFPLAVVGAEGWALPNWVQGYERYWLTRKLQPRRADNEGSARPPHVMHKMLSFRRAP